MVNLLVKTAATATTKKIAFPKLNLSDRPRTVAKRMATYMGKVRAASEDHTIVCVEDVERLIEDMTGDSQEIVTLAIFNELPRQEKLRLNNLVASMTNTNIGYENDVDSTEHPLVNLPVMVIDNESYKLSRSRKEYRLVFDDSLCKVKGYRENSRYRFARDYEYAYSCVSYSLLQLLVSSGQYHPRLSTVESYALAGKCVIENYGDAFQASLNARFASNASKTIATITDDKIYQDKELNQNTIFNQLGFRKCEIDTEKYQGSIFDKKGFKKIEDDWLKLCNQLPHSAQEPEFKMRKLGKHKAAGLYVPSLNILAIDVRDTNSFIHEYGHYLDFTYQDDGQPISTSNEAFKEISKLYVSALETAVEEDTAEAKAIRKKMEYYITPTEIFARAFELWVHTNIDGTTELTKSTKPNKKTKGYQGIEYRAFSGFLHMVYEFFNTYFDGFKDKQKVYSVQPVVTKAVSYQFVKKDVAPTNVGEQLSLFDF